MFPTAVMPARIHPASPFHHLLKLLIPPRTAFFIPVMIDEAFFLIQLTIDPIGTLLVEFSP
ncbi:hypothetical protein DEJ21_11195 [Curtobacterium sp. MCSS17_006]|nr:hypothetical protein DEJ21_11195 [Curtobacterium sp. MCSS17_006]